VIEGTDRSGPAALPIVEIVPREEDFYNFTARYEIGRTTYVCPAELPAADTERLQAIALRVYELFGCYGFARVDMILDGDGVAQVLEINAIPGLTETSLLPQAAEAAGISFDDLIARLVEAALTRGGGAVARA
jgi:D-alanine-D-alanine ligase